VLSTDQIYIVLLTCKYTFCQTSRKLHQPARLAKCLIVLEERHDVFKRGVERVRFLNFFYHVSNIRSINMPPIFCGFDPTRIGIRYFADYVFIRHFTDQALTKNLVNLAALQGNGRNTFCLAAGFILEVCDGFTDCFGLFFVGT